MLRRFLSEGEMLHANVHIRAHGALACDRNALYLTAPVGKQREMEVQAEAGFRAAECRWDFFLIFQIQPANIDNGSLHHYICHMNQDYSFLISVQVENWQKKAIYQQGHMNQYFGYNLAAFVMHSIFFSTSRNIEDLLFPFLCSVLPGQNH